MNVSWPRSLISNDTLYSTTPLSKCAVLSRWKMLGHIFRSDERSPAQVVLCFFIQQCEENVGRLGCHRRDLLHHSRVDLKQRFILLKTLYILYIYMTM